MDIDEPSSPPHLHSSLPPSSAPDPPLSSNGRPPRRVADALAIGDDDPADASQDANLTTKKRKRTKGIGAGVPLVKDAVGESVSENFETFLKTSVQLQSKYCLLMIHDV
jgi:DNA replication licensing factor MCM6